MTTWSVGGGLEVKSLIVILVCLMSLPVTSAGIALAQDQGVIDDLQGIRRDYKKQFKFDLDKGQTVQDPEIAGTKLIVNAMTQLDQTTRSRQIDSTVALLRNHPDVVESVFERAIAWIKKNPQMAERATEVLRAVADGIDMPSTDKDKRFALPGGF
jgi:hypothetical protein|tara:strand:- start:625 stop:1092 length:468 start_codon:yes stop_codon:yes gene_type:complete